MGKVVKAGRAGGFGLLHPLPPMLLVSMLRVAWKGINVIGPASSFVPFPVYPNPNASVAYIKKLPYQT